MSEANVVDRGDNGLPIPTICLDSSNESDSHADSSTNHTQFVEDHSFTNNVSHLFSWLSCFGADRKFMVAVALISQCGPTFTNFASAILQNQNSVGSEQAELNLTGSTLSDYLSQLHSDCASFDGLLKELSKVLPVLIKSGFHDIVTPTKYRSNTENGKTSCEHAPCAESSIWDWSHMKSHYLRLLSDVLCHCEELTEFADIQKSELFSEALKDVVLLSPLGQLLVKTMLCLPLTRDDRHELMFALRSRRDLVSSTSVSSVAHTEASPGNAADKNTLALIDVLLEILTDLSSVAQAAHDGFENAVFSLSHSLTSSGFLSGSGGSGSQYDLLSETSNGPSLVGSHFGTLLTVPHSDSRFANNPLTHPHWDPRLSQRRVSDSPLFTTSCSAHSIGFHHSDRSNQTTSSTSHAFVPNRSSLQSVHESSMFQPIPQTTKADVPAVSATNDRAMQSVGVQTVESMSLSNESSTYSSNVDLGRSHVHQNNVSSSPVTSYAKVSPNILSLVDASGDSPCLLHPPDAKSNGFSKKAPYSCPNVSSECAVLFDPCSCLVIQSADDQLDATNRLTFSSESRNGAPYNDCAMAVVPFWLKSLRLHKYAKLFESLTYEEFLGVSDAWLQARNVTQGARTKLLLNIRKLATRASTLSQAEDLLLQTPVSTPGSTNALRHCLSQIWNILQTPIKVCSAIATGRPCSMESTIAEVSICREPPDSDTYQSFPEGHECLPDRIMSCLTKVCSRLLVSPQPDSECCVKFVELLDIIATHPAFLGKHKSLVSSWRQQMVYLHMFVPQCPSQDLSLNVATSRLGSKPWCKHPISGHRQIFGRSCGAERRSCKRFSPPCQAHEFHCCVPFDWDTSGQPFVTNQFSTATKYNNSDGSSYNAHPVDDSAIRRRSIPTNRSYFYSLASARPFQGKRMPSPNPRSVPPYIDASATLHLCPSIPGMVATSDTEMPFLASQLSRARMPSPSGLEFRFPAVNRCTLIPPATAPPTRMPSPSDLHRHNGVYHFSECEHFAGHGSLVSMACTSDERFSSAHRSTLSVPSALPENAIPVCQLRYLDRADEFVRVHDPAVWLRQTGTMSGAPVHSPLTNVSPSVGLVCNANFNRGALVNASDGPNFRCPTGADSYTAFPLTQCSSYSSPSHWPAMPTDPSVSAHRTNAQAETNHSLDHIELDLEMLTRNVTELAIGDFDSPGE